MHVMLLDQNHLCVSLNCPADTGGHIWKEKIDSLLY